MLKASEREREREGGGGATGAGTGAGANGGNESRIALHFVWPGLILIYGRKFAPFAPTLETPLLGVFIQMFSERSSRLPRPAQPPHVCVSLA